MSLLDAVWVSQQLASKRAEMLENVARKELLKREFFASMLVMTRDERRAYFRGDINKDEPRNNV